MKQCIVILSLFISFSSFGQVKSFDSTWRMSFYGSFFQRNFTDSCYCANVLIKIDINKRSRITSLQFSDNAELMLIQAFDDLKRYNNLLEKSAAKNKIKNTSLILPLTITSAWADSAKGCIIKLKNCFQDTNRSYFNGKSLTGKCIFLPPCSLTIWPTSD